jgi:hypothetical protein
MLFELGPTLCAFSTDQAARSPFPERLEGVVDLDALEPRALLEPLAKRGALLVRGAHADLPRFEQLTQRLCHRFHVSGARRHLRAEGDGFSTRTSGRNFALLPHTEGSYRPPIDFGHPESPVSPRHPEVCFFFCEAPPLAAGGETLLLDGVRLCAALTPAVRERFIREGIGFHSEWEPARFEAEFGTSDRALIDTALRRVPNTRHEFVGDTLHLDYVTDAIVQTASGGPAFATAAFAHLPFVPHRDYGAEFVHAKPENRVFFGGGEPLSEALVCELLESARRLTVAHRWQRGDVLLLDNRRVLHGRNRTLVDCERVIYSRFGWLRTSPLAAAALESGS